MINVSNSIILIAVTAIVTFFLRAVPFLIFGKKGMPAILEKVAGILPAAIIGVLVVYCIKSDIIGFKDLLLNHTTDGISDMIATLVALISVVVIHVWKRHTLLSIAVGTIVYMALIRLLPIIL